MTDPIARIVNASWFNRLILLLILLAALIVGLETYPTVVERWGGVIFVLDQLILWAFAVEAALKIAQHGRHWQRYFQDPWNVFDFTIVVVCFLPMEGEFAAVLRLARVLRATRLISALPKLQLLVSALLKSIPSMGYVGLLLGLMFYVYAVMGVFLFRENDPVHFANLQVALLSLFRVVTLEDWTDIMYIQMYGSDVYGLANVSDLPIEPKAQPVVSVIYFVSFVLMGTMIVLNLFIGVIISSMQEAQAEAASRVMKDHEDPTIDDELGQLERELHDLQETIRMIRHRVRHGGG